MGERNELHGDAERIASGTAHDVPRRPVSGSSLPGRNSSAVSMPTAATRALEIGLVTKVVPRDQLWERAHRVAAIVAAKPTLAVQSTIRVLWESLEHGRVESLRAYGEWRVPRRAAERGPSGPERSDESGNA